MPFADLRLDALKPEDGSELVVKALYQIPGKVTGDLPTPSATTASATMSSGITFVVVSLLGIRFCVLCFMEWCLFGRTREECHHVSGRGSATCQNEEG